MEFRGKTVSAEFWENRPKICGNCAFPQNFHVRKLGEITVFFAVHCFQFFNAEVHTFLITFYFVLFDWTAGLELGTRQSHQ